MITLYNVTDIRTGRHHSVAEIEEWKRKYFIEVKANEVEK